MRLIASALRDLLGERGITASDLAEITGADLSTAARWLKGTMLLSRAWVKRIEQSLDLPLGTIERRAGYVEDPTSLLNFVRSTQELTETQKLVVLPAIASWIEETSSSRSR